MPGHAAHLHSSCFSALSVLSLVLGHSQNLIKNTNICRALETWASVGVSGRDFKHLFSFPHLLLESIHLKSVHRDPECIAYMNS